MKKVFWVSGVRATFVIEVTHNIVTKAAPIARKFIGQSASALVDWFDIDEKIWLQGIKW